MLGFFYYDYYIIKAKFVQWIKNASFSRKSKFLSNESDLKNISMEISSNILADFVVDPTLTKLA